MIDSQLIVFEGQDTSGNVTLAVLLCRRLNDAGRPAAIARPATTTGSVDELAWRLHEVSLHGASAVATLACSFLQLAGRAQVLRNLILHFCLGAEFQTKRIQQRRAMS